MRYDLKFFAAASMVFCVSTNADARAELCNAIHFEGKKSIPLQDVGRLGDQKVISGAAGTIVYWPFDDEDHPLKKGAYAIGLIFARIGDLGETPVGGYLWTTVPIQMVDTPVTGDNKGEVSVTFNLHQKSANCQASSFTFTLQPNGDVYANGTPVGKVK